MKTWSIPPAFPWWQPLGVAAGSAALAVVLSLAIPDTYRSEARVLPSDAKGFGGLGGQVSAMANTFGLASPLGEGEDASYVEILKSRWMAEGLLGTSYVFHARAWVGGRPERQAMTLSQYLKARNPDEACRRLTQVLTVTRDPKSKLLSVSVETKAPELSQAVVQKAVALLGDYVVAKGRTHGGRKAVFTAARLADARKEMDEAEAALREFSDRNRNYQVSPDPRTRLHGARLEMEVKLRQQLLITIALNHEAALLEEKNDVPLLNVLDPGNLPSEKASPRRAVLGFLGFLAGLLGALVWRHRTWLATRIRESAAMAVSRGEGEKGLSD